MANKLKFLQIRAKVIDAIRTFLKNRGLLEVSTPILVSSLPAEAHLEIFETTLLDRNRNPQKKYLITSPELALKKLLCEGIGSCFEITRSFRNMETQSKTHNPEFTILEWYEIEKTYVDLMTSCEKLLVAINSKINPDHPSTLTYQNQVYDLKIPWTKMSVTEAFTRFAHVDLPRAMELESMKNIFLAKKYTLDEETTWEQMFDQIMLNEIEPQLQKLHQPVILYDYPSAMAMLAKKKTSNPDFSERFEFYLAGLELGDCYNELIDWQEQEKRFHQEAEKIKRDGKTEYPIDWEFINYLKNPGLPPCSGIAIGIDRLVMLFADCDNIKDVL